MCNQPGGVIPPLSSEEAPFNIIPPAAEAERADGNPQEAEDVSLIAAEYKQLQDENDKYNNEKRDLENKKVRIEIAMMRLNLRMKNRFSQNVFKYLWFYSGFCAFVVLLQGFNPDIDVHSFHIHLWNVEFRLKRFNLDNKVLITLQRVVS